MEDVAPSMNAILEAKRRPGMPPGLRVIAKVPRRSCHRKGTPANFGRLESLSQKVFPFKKPENPSLGMDTTKTPRPKGEGFLFRGVLSFLLTVVR
jgi:hypothetical protein